MFRVLNSPPIWNSYLFCSLRKGDYLENSQVVFCQNMPSFFTFMLNKALNKRHKLNRNEISFSHSFFIVICCLSVVLQLDKGDFPENLHTVCPCQNK